MIVTNFVNKIILRGKNTSYNDIVRCSYKHRTIIVRPLYEHRKLTMIVQPSYEHRTWVVRSSLYIYFFTTQLIAFAMIVRGSYEHRKITMIVLSSYGDRTSVVRWSYNYRTIIVRSSYDDYTKVVRSSLFYLRVARSSLYLSTFAWWRGVPAGGVTNRKRGPPKNRFAYLNDGTLGGYRPANLKSVGITMLVRW